MNSDTIIEVDALRLQIAWLKKERAREAFDAEVIRISVAYGLTATDTVDMDTGKITRQGKLEAVP